jgi:hypothetical protein
MDQKADSKIDRVVQKPNQVTMKGCPSISGVANGTLPPTSNNKTKKHRIKI